MAKKKSERARAKNRAWYWFSRYIRLTHCVEEYGTPEKGDCITCKETFPFEKLDAGHFVPGRTDAVIFDENNSHGQCRKCNRFRQGRWVEYFFYMRDRYGLEEVMRIMGLTFKSIRYHDSDFRVIAETYRIKCKIIEEKFRDE
jgi:hypothetical protein